MASHLKETIAEEKKVCLVRPHLFWWARASRSVPARSTSPERARMSCITARLALDPVVMRTRRQIRMCIDMYCTVLVLVEYCTVHTVQSTSSTLWANRLAMVNCAAT